MTSNTVSLHYTLEGPEGAPVLVMSNSLGTSLSMWEDQTPTLREHFRLLRYDHRGHGGSPVPPDPYGIDVLGQDVFALLDRLGIESFSFCGLSLGGMVGMWVASHAPGRVERLVLCCTSAKLGPPENWASRAATIRSEGLESVREASMERWFTPEFRQKSPETVKWSGRMLLGTPAEGYAGCCEVIRDMDLTRNLGDIQAPTLIIAGAEDEATPVDHSEFIHNSVPDSRLEVVSQAAHLANVEQPEALTRAILEHLEPVSANREKT